MKSKVVAFFSSVRLRFEKVVSLYYDLLGRVEMVVIKIREVDSEIGCSRVLPSLIVQKMLVVAEDKRFWSHPGFDILAILRSIAFTAAGRSQGGSTVIQQLVRIITGRYERTIRRKVEEIFVAYHVSKALDRSIFLRVYLSMAYYGAGMEGFDRFIDKKMLFHIGDLDLATMAVARLKYPEPSRVSERRFDQIRRREAYLVLRFNAFKNKEV
ncbi:transglycosylase domain-containing protein [Pseudomonas alliivorans]|uniref:transglycosylase domain-containing protein n=1 Tax=Pseudomonas alliivorans TaxID=2810613 RepID=UPI001AEAD9B8|nr:transglycosylase domain-containing protein [Pseudomonas alliivorans]MBP0943070.1 transglycosylase domain-containing protein [Pseudomonas alliivorans]MEE4881166.1 transglycosylase domain-containing protein [Pseudomonas alliivorans]MEE4932470.1 transglycosylase domain-containing protein [Pseudomonas alliivorans]MEE4937933.1 transglycosylase domain-containing protein [Pseudomonas alliivorans]MEE4943134.1 transglycosylase domain-containing protein [Pseudomonas alliivorans]